MLRILRAYGILDRSLHAIDYMYTRTRANFVSPDEEIPLFDITAGVLYGGILAFYIFILMVEYM